MPPLPASRFLPSRRLLVVLPLLAFAGIGGWYVHSRGGMVNALRLPPILDASTPQAQGGYTLIKISRNADADPTSSLGWPIVAYLLIKPPGFPACTQQSQMLDGLHVYTVQKGAADPIVQATAKTSEGDVTPLIWLIVGNDAGPQYLRVQIPGGYSGDCRFLDVSLVTNNGPFPCWRLTRLPPMRPSIPRPITAQSAATANGVSLTAEAHRIQKMIRLQTRVVAPPQSHQWEITMSRQRSEWEGYDDAPLQSSVAWPISSMLEHTKYDWYAAPYHSTSRYVSAYYTLQQYETHDEPVTFHGVDIRRDEDEGPLGLLTNYVRLQQAQTITTPSGVTVTLPAQGQGAQHGLQGDCFNFFLSVEPFGPKNALPASPLAKTYGKPVSISLAFPSGQSLSSWTTEDGSQHQYAIRDRRVTHLGPQDFTVIIRQRVDLQTAPVTLTIPVSDTIPPDFYTYFHPHKKAQ